MPPLRPPLRRPGDLAEGPDKEAERERTERKHPARENVILFGSSAYANNTPTVRSRAIKIVRAGVRAATRAACSVEKRCITVISVSSFSVAGNRQFPCSSLPRASRTRMHFSWEWQVFHHNIPMKSARLLRESSKSGSSVFEVLQLRANDNKTLANASGVLEAAGPDIVGLLSDFPR